ncbi:hypothetical protein NKH18_27380 [Streptomyces sp. M10(2022)]
MKLWPGLDAYDLLVEAGPKRAKKVPFKVDVKDYTSAATLAKLIHAQDGDRGGAEWLVVPDYRARQVPLLSGCAKSTACGWRRPPNSARWFARRLG